MLAVYKNNKNLAKKDISGELKPFFWLGDTAVAASSEIDR